MSHRSGLVREPPVGNYFDPDEPSLAKTVESLNRTELVYEPESADSSTATPASPRSASCWSRRRSSRSPRYL